MASRADSHDLDKLDRWRQGLDGGDLGTFPVYAIFLVGPDDRLSHDIFRKYRDSFDARNAGFHNLVIFGQHGISTTVTEFLSRLDLEMDFLPCLLLAAGSSERQAGVVPLPSGGHPGPEPRLEREDNLDQPWQLALERIEEAVKTSAGLDLSPVPEVATASLGGEELSGLVKSLQAALARSA